MNLAASSLFLLIQAAVTQPATAAAPRGCESLAQTTLPKTTTTITLAQTVGGGEFSPAGDKSGGPVSPGAIRNLPPFCRVAATLAPSSDSEIRIELWMPISGWN